MKVSATRSLRILQSQPHRHFANFTPKQTPNNSVMQPKFSEGQDESKVTIELNALIESGWKLDEEQIGVEKTSF